MMKRQIAALAGLGVVGCFSMAALVLSGPVTPIKFDVGPAAAVLNPHLSQSWQLFAPDPISDERGVVARMRCAGGVTGWKDISSAPIARTQGSRFFPPRESRVLSNAIVERFAHDDITKRLEEKKRSALLPADDAAARRAEHVLARYAVRVAPCPKGDTADRVQLRYVTRDIPAWSKRSTGAGRVEAAITDSDWIQP
jgi:hypothetical protein